MLAVYPQRLATNRAEPVPLPGRAQRARAPACRRSRTASAQRPRPAPNVPAGLRGDRRRRLSRRAAATASSQFAVPRRPGQRPRARLPAQGPTPGFGDRLPARVAAAARPNVTAPCKPARRQPTAPARRQRCLGREDCLHPGRRSSASRGPPRPGRSSCCWSSRVLALGGRRARAAPAAEHGDRHARGRSAPSSRRPSDAAPALRRRRGRTCWCASRSAKLVLTADLERLIAPGGLPRRQRAQGREPVRRREQAVRGARRSSSRSRSSTAPARSSTSRSRQIQDAVQRAAGRRSSGAGAEAVNAALRAGARRRATRKAEPQAPAAAGAAARAGAGTDATRSSSRSSRASRASRRSTTRAFISQLVFDPARGAGHAEGALRLPLPEPRRCADPGAAASPDLSDASAQATRSS